MTRLSCYVWKFGRIIIDERKREDMREEEVIIHFL